MRIEKLNERIEELIEQANELVRDPETTPRLQSLADTVAGVGYALQNALEPLTKIEERRGMFLSMTERIKINDLCTRISIYADHGNDSRVMDVIEEVRQMVFPPEQEQTK